MSDVFISYARSTEGEAMRIAEALRGLGYGVWRDDELPAHRDYAEVIEERLKAAKAVVVVWSAEAVRSQWVRAEADLAREAGSLVQLTLDGAPLPMPFNRIQCADMAGWTGDSGHGGWRKVAASVADLVGGAAASSPQPIWPRPAAPPLPDKASIVVLPFANLSGDPDQDYFADGMVEEITTALSRFRSLFVVGSGSGLSFKGMAITPQEVGRQLGVRYLLEGSVRKAGNRLRIGVQLIEASEGRQIWSGRFEDTLEDVFALQDRVALSVAATIEPSIREVETRRVSRRPTNSMDAHELTLRASALFRTYGKNETVESLELLNSAVTIDPNYGFAMARAAIVHLAIFVNDWSENPDEHRARGVEMAQRALRAAGDDADALATAAWSLSLLDRDLEGSLALAERAVNMNPGSGLAWLISGVLRLRTGDVEGATERLETSLRLDPYGPERRLKMSWIGMARFAQRRFGEALGHFKEGGEGGGFAFRHAMLAACYGHLGDRPAAQEAMIRYRAHSSRSAESYMQLANYHPAHIKLFLEGIALAEGSDSSAASQSS